MKQDLPNYELHRYGGSFRDAAQETAFRTAELDAAVPYLRKLLPLLGLAFLAFVIPDYWVLGPGLPFCLTLVTRVCFSALMVHSSLRMSTRFSLHQRELLLALATFAGIAAFGAALHAYRNANFHLQAVSVMLMIVAAYLIPNRFLVSFIASGLLACMGILYLLLFAPPGLKSSEHAAYIGDFLLFALLSALLWRGYGRTRRREYARTRELEWLSRTDLLTGIGNRRDFETRMASALARKRRYGEDCALILLDIDRFKNVNDRLGHHAGDEVLKEIARRLESSLRVEDFLARWGGEEFVLLLPRATPESAREFAARIRERISGSPCGPGGTITASAGISMLKGTDDTDSALARADQALYRAKEGGRDRVEFED